MAAINMNKIFMLDIETTGVDPTKEEVLQIALLEMNFDGHLWQRGRDFNFFQHTLREPTTKFAQDHMQDIYAKCRAAPMVQPEVVRQNILKFCKECGAEPPNIFFTGWNAGIFDVPFLAHHGYLEPARYENDKLVGDCHYRIYELSGALQFLANVRGHNEINSMIKESHKVLPPPEGNRHDALYDCERQLAILNGLILMGRGQGLTRN